MRYLRPTQEELRENLSYVSDAEDEVWLLNNSKFGGSCDSSSGRPTEALSAISAVARSSKKRDKSGSTTPGGTTREDGTPTFQLPIVMLETMMDVMEKATAFEAIITMDQAEGLILRKLPQLYHMYPIKARAGVVTVKHVITDVYNYWVSKRSKLKRPLLRLFWPVTSSDDTNPHLVFRPREKEKYKLRKKRQNDMDAYRKLQQLKQDFQHVRVLLDLVRRREELNRCLVQLQSEWFQQKIFDAIDTSGLPRLSKELRRDEMDELLNVTTYFDTQNGWKKNKKSRRGSLEKPSRSTTPIPDGAGGGGANAGGTGLDGTDTVGPVAGTTPNVPKIVAGQNHGEPAPLFLHPLVSRETYVSSWEGSTPHITTYVDSNPLPTFRFRHRPRVGRGGRLCIDRLPQPPISDITPITVFTAGNGLPRSIEPKHRLLDLLPTPLEHDALSSRVEAICLDALKEDYDRMRVGGPPTTSPVLGGVLDVEENDGEEVVVNMDEWLGTDNQIWGEERFSIGPL